MTAIPDQPQRLYFVDRLKLFLTLGVILVHACQPWAFASWWPVPSPHKSDLLTRIVFAFTSFFMGLFFFFSAYFFRPSYDRRGALGFLGNRLLRFGVPLVIYLSAVVPCVMYAYYLNFRDHGYLSFCQYYLRVYGRIGVTGYSGSEPISVASGA